MLQAHYSASNNVIEIIEKDLECLIVANLVGIVMLQLVPPIMAATDGPPLLQVVLLVLYKF